MQVFPTTESVTVDYPYGRLRTDATFSLEYVAKKGFRSVFQTINPKNGRVNAPKKGSYRVVMLMVKDPKSGHINFLSGDFNGIKESNAACKMIAENFDKFTPEQIKSLYVEYIAYSNINVIASVQWGGADQTKLLEIITNPVKLAVKGTKDGQNYWTDLVIDYEQWEAAKR